MARSGRKRRSRFIVHVEESKALTDFLAQTSGRQGYLAVARLGGATPAERKKERQLDRIDDLDQPLPRWLVGVIARELQVGQPARLRLRHYAPGEPKRELLVHVERRERRPTKAPIPAGPEPNPAPLDPEPALTPPLHFLQGELARRDATLAVTREQLGAERAKVLDLERRLTREEERRKAAEREGEAMLTLIERLRAESRDRDAMVAQLIEAGDALHESLPSWLRG